MESRCDAMQLRVAGLHGALWRRGRALRPMNGGSALGHGTVEMRKKVDKRACALQRVSTRRCECGTVNHRRCRACDVVIGIIDIWTCLRPAVDALKLKRVL